MDKAAIFYLLITSVKIVVVFTVVITAVAYYGFAERRLCAFMQDRVGPNRCGPWGILQPLADGIKFLFKEDVIPDHVNRPLYVLAPILVMVPAFITFAAVPFGSEISVAGHSTALQVGETNIGILYIFAIVSISIYGIIISGWASNNKYSLLGGLRASAQVISYELAMGLSVIGVLMVYESLTLGGMVEAQSGVVSWLPWLPRWGIFVQPLGALIFVVASFAETNRVPFDLPESESELVAGYHVEYSSMKFAMFYMGEYSNMVTSAALMTTIFLGGWQLPFVSMEGWDPLVRALTQIGVFTGKTALFAFMFIWVRWTLPRFRYDQLMRLGWRVMLPLALFNIVATGFCLTVKYGAVAR